MKKIVFVSVSGSKKGLFFISIMEIGIIKSFMWKIMKRLYWKGKEGLRKYCRDKNTIGLMHSSDGGRIGNNYETRGGIAKK